MMGSGGPECAGLMLEGWGAAEPFPARDRQGGEVSRGRSPSSSRQMPREESGALGERALPKRRLRKPAEAARAENHGEKPGPACVGFILV